MIGLDACFLIDLYWTDSPRHVQAVRMARSLGSQKKVMAYYNIFNEFIHVITDSRRFEHAMTMQQALDIVDEWCDLANVTVVYPDDNSYKRFVTWMKLNNLGRYRVNDTTMAACYAESGVTEIVTANPKDFECFECFAITDYASMG